MKIETCPKCGIWNGGNECSRCFVEEQKNDFEKIYIPIKTFKEILHLPSSVVVYLAMCSMETMYDNQVSARSVSEYTGMALSTINFGLKKLVKLGIVDYDVTSESSVYWIKDGK